MSKCMQEHIYPERLEGCTVLHLAALSGDHNMVIAVTTIWEEVHHVWPILRLHLIRTTSRLHHTHVRILLSAPCPKLTTQLHKHYVFF